MDQDVKLKFRGSDVCSVIHTMDQEVQPKFRGSDVRWTRKYNPNSVVQMSVV